MAGAKRICIIGSKGFVTETERHRVDCFSWDRLDKLPNLSDYDALILNLLPLDDTAKRDKVDWSTFSRHLNLSSAKEILNFEGEIVVLGDPRFSIRPFSAAVKDKDQPFLHWSGMTFR